MSKRRFRSYSSHVIFILVIAIMIYFGVRTDREYTRNRVDISSSGEGAAFSRSSMVYSPYLKEIQSDYGDYIALELTVSPHYFERPRFGIILQIYDFKENTEISIGQWDKSLMVLDSNDYSNRRREPKIYAPMDTESDLQNIIITSGPEGTSVTINGKEAGFNPSLSLKWPENGSKTRLILGNGFNGRSPWTGNILSLELSPYLNYELSSLDDWQDIGFIKPENIQSLERDFLRIPHIRSLDTVTMISDIFWNFFGFLPFGYLLMKRRKKLLFVLLVSFLFSFSIEIVQIWLPGRDSSLLDLALNTLGGGAGALTAGVKKRKTKD